MRLHRRQDLAADLRQLGVETGDILFVHSSFKSLGLVEHGAVTVIEALEEVLGPQGLLLMPSFNLIEHSRRAATWDREKTPSTVGWLTEYFRCMPGTFRSDHFSHSTAARGNQAEQFVADHHDQAGCAHPLDLKGWGKMYGSNSPMLKAYDAGGKLMMLGVDYESSTYTHVAEVIDWDRRSCRDPQAQYRWLNRSAVGRFWEKNGPIRYGKVGDADCRFFSIPAYVDTLLQELEHRPHHYAR